MTTYNLDTVIIHYDVDTNNNTLISAGTTRVVVPEGQTTITFVDADPSGDQNLVPTSPLYNVYGTFGDIADSPILLTQVVDVSWNFAGGSGSGTYLSVEYENYPDGYTEIIRLSGDPIPFSTLSEFNLFFSSGPSITPHFGAFAPGNAISLSGVPAFASQTEDDEIRGYDDPDLLEGGAGNDTITGGAGNDTISDGEGNDSMDGGLGRDDYVFGGGEDTINDTGNDGNYDAVYVDRSNQPADAFEVLFDMNTGQHGAVGTTVGQDLVLGIEDYYYTGPQNVTVFGNFDHNLIQTDSGSDGLVGNAGNDFLSGGIGEDFFVGGEGNDTIVGGNEGGDDDFDTLDYFSEGGGSAVTVDALTGTTTDSFGHTDSFSEIEVVNGTALADSFTSGNENIRFRGGDGADTFTVGGTGAMMVDYRPEIGVGGTQGVVTDLANGQITDTFGNIDTIIGEIARIRGTDEFGDLLIAGDWGMRLEGRGGDDTLNGRDGDDTLEGDEGNDVITGGAGNDYIEGNDGDDDINGGFAFDQVFGGAGNDTIVGLNGYDTLMGGGDDDSITGNFGFDSLMGEDGNDTLQGGLGLDTLDGGEGADLLEGQAGSDNVVGGGGNDTLNGNSGADTLAGEEGRDTLNGGINNDLLQGGDGNDTLSGSNGADTLLGEGDDDILNGNAGADRLDGGAGNDILRGGIGADTFVFAGDVGTDVVIDFQNNIDTIEIEAALLGIDNPTADDLRPFTSLNDDGNLVISLPGGHTVTFNNVGTTGAILDDVVFV